MWITSDIPVRRRGVAFFPERGNLTRERQSRECNRGLTELDQDELDQDSLFKLLPFAAVAQALSQSPFTVDNVSMSLAAITSEQSFTTLSHPRFPNHSVRIKKSTFCDPTVSSVYLDSSFCFSRHLL